MLTPFLHSSVLDQAGDWFLRSGIQEANGGVARYARTDTATNLPISNEITGYAASTFAYLFERTGNPAYQAATLRAANFLYRDAWDADNSTFPFEPGSDRAYFFDLGIIARGLLAAARVTGESAFRERAQEAALSLAFDFLGEAVFHPIIALPEKQPFAPEPRWSRQPGCFQLKSALIWRELGDPHAARMFDTALAIALASHPHFLVQAPASGQDADQLEAARCGLMDRLHAYCYFLEALLWATEHPEAREALIHGMDQVGRLLREISPLFERSDVGAQLLRVRLIAHHQNVVALDTEAAREEAARVASFQVLEGENAANTRLAGGFWFGSKHGRMLPFSNPVSTAFSLQALTLWDDFQNNRWEFHLSQLI